MPRGGARAMSGPPSDPDALRRNRPGDAAGWKTIAVEGRQVLPPEWALLDVQPREWCLRLDLWSLSAGGVGGEGEP